MVKALDRDGRTSFRLGKDEATLDNRLDMEREAFRRPLAVHAEFPHRRANVGFERLCMTGNVPFAGRTHVRMGAVGFLNDGARKAGEVGEIARQYRLAKIDVCDEPLERVGGVMIRRFSNKM